MYPLGHPPTYMYSVSAKPPNLLRWQVDVLLNGEPEYMVYNARSCARMLQLQAHTDNLFVQSLRESERKVPAHVI